MRHMFERMFTSVLVLEFVFITFRGSFQQCASEIVNHLQPDRTVLPYHPSVKSCSSGSIEVWMK